MTDTSRRIVLQPEHKHADTFAESLPRIFILQSQQLCSITYNRFNTA